MPDRDDQPATDRNMLTRSETFRLMTWLSCERDRLEKTPTTYATLAAAASSKLEFSVSRGNVAGALKDLGIQIRFAREPRAKQTTSKADLVARLDSALVRIEQLEGRLADLSARLETETADRKRVHAVAVATSSKLDALARDLGGLPMPLVKK